MIETLLTKHFKFEKTGSIGMLFFAGKSKINSTFEARSQSHFLWVLHLCCSLSILPFFNKGNKLNLKKFIIETAKK